MLSDAMGARGLVRGQYQDLREGSRARKASEIAKINHLKTEGVVRRGAGDGGAGRACQRRRVYDAARDDARAEPGLPMYDDLCDGEPDAQLCKNRGKDAGKSTLVALLGQEAARHRLHGHVQRIDTLPAGVYGAGGCCTCCFHVCAKPTACCPGRQAGRCATAGCPGGGALKASGQPVICAPHFLQDLPS
ncbi:hypothetical protein GCM10027514_08290 [Azotobacter armeniacus]